MSQKIGGAEHDVIPSAGHACCLEDPAAFDEIVLIFLKKHKFTRRLSGGRKRSSDEACNDPLYRLIVACYVSSRLFDEVAGEIDRGTRSAYNWS